MTLYAILAAILAAIAGAFGLHRSAAKGARDKIRADQAEAAVAADRRGDKAEFEARQDLAKGKTPEQIVRENDAKWD